MRRAICHLPNDHYILSILYYLLYIIDSILLFIIYYYIIDSILFIINYILYIIMTHTRCCASNPHTWLASQPNERKAPDIVRE